MAQSSLLGDAGLNTDSLASCARTRALLAADEVVGARSPGIDASRHDVPMTDETEISLRLVAGVWAIIDAEMDNTVDAAAEDGLVEFVQMGQAIREAGSKQVPWVDGKWPPMDQEITIALTRAQWDFALTEVEESIPSYERLGNTVGAQWGRDVVAALREGGI